MGNVCHVLQKKGNETFFVTPDTVVYDALVVMCEKNISALVVMENERLTGIFTERDYARKLILQGKSSKETLISEIMSSELLTVSPDTTIDYCMLLMTENFIRHLPVIEGSRLRGIISIGDVVKHIIEEQKFIIKNMEHYITGS